MKLQHTYLPVHGSPCERADNSLGPLQAFLPAGLILCLLLLGLLKAISPVGLITFPLQLCNKGAGLPIWTTDLPIGHLLLLCFLAVVLPDGLILL